MEDPAPPFHSWVPADPSHQDMYQVGTSISIHLIFTQWTYIRIKVHFLPEISETCLFNTAFRLFVWKEWGLNIQKGIFKQSYNISRFCFTVLKNTNFWELPLLDIFFLPRWSSCGILSQLGRLMCEMYHKNPAVRPTALRSSASSSSSSLSTIIGYFYITLSVSSA